ncbi:MAG TPA: hypothetical protein PLS81_01375 [Deltaproteobacteria bacterium]|nr:hypothetical protein [Deltaproteobacteria bacterium]HOM28093.1 hypothetical protein [Deltaproteobacteria bacterium]HPP80536.1 hypothetical protein [Deltaproteobacteria bacterium]
MQKVPIELVKPGMVLAKTVCNESGMALCGEGTELTDTIIERLKRMNISHVVLKGHPVDMGESKTTEEKLADLEARFERCRKDPLMERVLEAARAALVSLDEERAEQEQREEGSR